MRVMRIMQSIIVCMLSMTSFMTIMSSGCASMLLNHRQDVQVINVPKGASIAVPQRPTPVLDLNFMLFYKINRSDYRSQQLILDLKKSLNRQDIRTNTINTLRDGTQAITIERDRHIVIAQVFCGKRTRPVTVHLKPRLNMVFWWFNLFTLPNIRTSA